MGTEYKLPFSAEELLEKSRRETAIELVDTAAIEPLKVLIQAVNDEAKLHEQGVIDLEKWFLRSLNNRLRMKRDYAAHPEIAEQEIKAPIFVIGSTRTGSTKMQKLLAATGDFNWLTFWQSLNPSLVSGNRDESPDPRIQDAQDYAEWFDRVSPNAKFIHELNTHEPEEESFILAHSLMSPCLTGMVEVPSYIQWLFAQDISSQFEFLRDTLKYLQWQGYADASKPWVLKTPFYAGLEPVLLKMFPGASLIMTHRHPVETMPSTCSLFTSYRQPYSDVVIDSSAVVAGAVMPLTMHLEVRKSMQEIKFLDFHFSEVTESAETVVERAYQFINRELSEEARKRVVEWDTGNPMHKKGKHKYSLADFDLTEAEINETFSDYMDMLDKLF